MNYSIYSFDFKRNTTNKLNAFCWLVEREGCSNAVNCWKLLEMACWCRNHVVWIQHTSYFTSFKYNFIHMMNKKYMYLIFWHADIVYMIFSHRWEGFVTRIQFSTSFLKLWDPKFPTVNRTLNRVMTFQCKRSSFSHYGCSKWPGISMW